VREEEEQLVEKSDRKKYITERNWRSSWEWQGIITFCTCQWNEWMVHNCISSLSQDCHISWTTVTTAWHILNLQIEETAKKKRGQGVGKRTDTSSSCNTNLSNFTNCITIT
jgi:hypothetical protein